MGAWVIGVGSTAFKKWPERSFRDLSSEAVRAAVGDAGLDDASMVEQVWFGNCAMNVWGQANIRGQVALAPLTADGFVFPRAPIGNVEGGCATGSLAFHSATKDVLSGLSDCSLAVGVEKTVFEDDPAKSFAVFASGIDQLHPDEWRRFYEEQAAAHGLEFAPSRHRVLFLDLHALQAERHMARFGTTREHLALVAAKNHTHAVDNERAQYRFPMTTEQVLEDRPIVGPLTRSMCSPLSDGAAAVLVCSDRFLERHPAARERALPILATAMSGGALRDLDEATLTTEAARRAWAMSGLGPEDVEVAEVHDATSFCEILHLESLGICAPGEGGPLAASGATTLGGRIPTNVSGGLESKGHPLGATGLGMIAELAEQLRGEAGTRQVRHEGNPPRVGLQHNAGGQIGWDEALCSVALLGAPA